MRYLSLVLISLGLCLGQGRWIEQDNPFDGEEFFIYYDVCFVDSLHGWAYGGGRVFSPTIVGTKDGGKTWEKLTEMGFGHNGESLFLNCPRGPGIKFVDTLHGWITLYWEGIAFTKDGGKTWEKVKLGLRDYPDIEFVDTLKGWCVTDEGVAGYDKGLIYHTEDGGESWVLQDSAPHPLRAVCFVNDKKGFVVGDSGVMMRTLDGGEHWELIDLGVTRTLYDIQFADSLHGIAVGGDVLKTFDGGNIWIKVEDIPPHLFYDVAYPTVNCIWTVAGSFAIFYSNDTGKTWEKQECGTYIPHLYGVSAPDSSHAWACGEWGKIIRYTQKTGVEEISDKAQNANYQLQVNPYFLRKGIEIRFSIPRESDINLKVYDAKGELVKVLVKGTRKVGSYSFYWDGRDKSGYKLSSGIYFILLSTNKGCIPQKIVVLK